MDCNENFYRVELHSKNKLVNVDRNKVRLANQYAPTPSLLACYTGAYDSRNVGGMRDDYGRMQGAYTPLRGDQTPMHGDRTPMHGDQTPMHGDRTPLHGDRTPLRGDRTPIHDHAGGDDWGRPNTPMCDPLPFSGLLLVLTRCQGFRLARSILAGPHARHRHVQPVLALRHWRQHVRPRWHTPGPGTLLPPASSAVAKS